MTLSPGTRLGPYEIASPVGAGGMGEVFRARDTKLNRDVAIKVLPAAFAQDAERVARFRREAQSANGYCAQNSPVLHFGLKAGTSYDLKVRFLDGTTVTRPGVQTTQRILVDGRNP